MFFKSHEKQELRIGWELKTTMMKNNPVSPESIKERMVYNMGTGQSRRLGAPFYPDRSCAQNMNLAYNYCVGEWQH